jgi:TonB family protein
MTQREPENPKSASFEEPTLSVFGLLLLALFGYAYIFLVTIGLLVLAVLGGYLLLKFHFYFLAKLALLLVLSAGLVLKASCVKFTPPEGLLIGPGQAPVLEQLISELALRSGSPKIHTILLNGDFNCGVAEYPRLGILGFHKNILCLGLPLLESLSLEEFKAVLAHELGHLSGKHGKFSCWVYHVRKSWQQILDTVHHEGAMGSFVLEKFAEWFVPVFSKQSLAICRAQELFADQLGAAVSGPEIMCKALITTAVAESFLSKKFATEMQSSILAHPEPPRNFYHRVRAQVATKPDPIKVATYLESHWRSHDEFNTHPSLPARLKALQPARDWSDVSTLVAEIASDGGCNETAAEALFPFVTDLRQQLSEQWYHNQLATWQTEHIELQKLKAEFFELEEVMGRNELTPEQASKLASLGIAVKDNEQAITLLRELADKFSSQAEVFYCFGNALLIEENDDCIKQFETAIRLDESYSLASLISMYSYLTEKNRQGEANAIMDRFNAYAIKKGNAPLTQGPKRSLGEYPESRQKFLNWKIVAGLIGVITMFVMYEMTVHTPQPVTPIVQDSDDDSYMRRMQYRIKHHWHPPIRDNSSKTVMRFRIMRDGKAADVTVAKSSGDKEMDQAAIDAIHSSAPFPELPPGHDESVDIEFTLEYNVRGRTKPTNE